MWTLAGASVECRVMSGATATGADQTSYAEKRGSAWGRGVWTLAEASVECNYAASATAHPAAMSRSPALVEQQPR